VRKIDVPVRQVMIEARIVEASDTFSRNLGARLGTFDRGFQNFPGKGDNKLTFGGSLDATGFFTSQIATPIPNFSQTLGVNMPASGLKAKTRAYFPWSCLTRRYRDLSTWRLRRCRPTAKARSFPARA
jgi:type II secretory pathway component HofQ